MLAGLAIVGCGGVDADGPQTYAEVLAGFERAIGAGSSSYGAERRAEDLPAPQRDVIGAFCEFARQVGLNREGWKLPSGRYAENRIKSHAYDNGNARYAELSTALDRLGRVVDFSTLNGRGAHRYSKAC